MTSLTFYGGVGEIGGNKILVEADDTRILLDFGMSFNQSNLYFAEFLQPKKCNGVLDFIELGLLPRLRDMSGLYRSDYLSHCGMETSPQPGYDAVFLSHAHADHSAYIHFLRQDIPIYASEVTKRILASMEETSAGGFNEFLTYQRTFETRPNKKGEGFTKLKGEEAKQPRDFSGLTSGDTVAIGNIKVEAVAVNHSIPGAIGFLIHTPEGAIAYTGDLRFHGYGGDLTEQFVERAAGVHPIALICEGTRIDQHESHSEQYVQDRVAEVVRKTKNLVIANYPWKDIERLRSFHEVAKATNRKLALNLKQAYLLRKLEGTDAGAPALDDDNIVIYIDRKSWGLVTKSDRPYYPPNVVEQDYSTWEREFLSYPNRVTCDDIHNHQGDFIVRIDFFDLTDLINIRPGKGSCYIRSVTEPFDDEGQIELQRVENWLKHFDLMPYEKVHASGHASGPEIKRLVEEINPTVVFPIHTEAPERFKEIKDVRVEMPQLGREYRL
jgi:ribonuclease J